MRAIDNVFAFGRKEPLLVGSIKSNIGHSEGTAGVSSIIKLLLAFNNGCIPPNINYDTPRKSIKGIHEGRLKVVLEATSLKTPYAATNSFGFGGANAHILFKMNEKEKVKAKEDAIPRLVCWSGRTDESVNSIFDELTKHPLDPEFLALLDNIQETYVPGFVSRGYGIFINGENGEKVIGSQWYGFSVVWAHNGVRWERI